MLGGIVIFLVLAVAVAVWSTPEKESPRPVFGLGAGTVDDEDWDSVYFTENEEEIK